MSKTFKTPATSQKVHRVIAGSPTKLMKIGDTEIECYVLDNGVRVLSNTGMQRSLGLSAAGGRLRGFTNKSALKPYVTPEIVAALDNPYKFFRPEADDNNRTTLANGVEATILKKICDAVLAFRHEHPLCKSA